MRVNYSCLIPPYLISSNYTEKPTRNEGNIMALDQVDMIKRVLLEAFPGSALTVIGETKRGNDFGGRDYPYRIIVEYNVELANELGVNQKMMRDVLRPLIDGDSYTYRNNTYNVSNLTLMVFKKKKFIIPNVSSELVGGIAAKLNLAAEKYGEEAVREITQTLMEDMSRAQRVRFEKALEQVHVQDASAPVSSGA